MKAYLSSGGLCPGRQLEQTGGSRLPSLLILFVHLVLFWDGITSFLLFIHGFKNEAPIKKATKAQYRFRPVFCLRGFWIVYVIRLQQDLSENAMCSHKSWFSCLLLELSVQLCCWKCFGFPILEPIILYCDPLNLSIKFFAPRFWLIHCHCHFGI